MSASSSRLGGNRGRLTEKRKSADVTIYPHSDPLYPESQATEGPRRLLVARREYWARCSHAGAEWVHIGNLASNGAQTFLCGPLADRLDESCPMEPLMEAPRLERKLVAILAADVEGYSRHMEQDEVATLATLSRHRLIVDELIARHSGRIIGTAGDSVLAEFVSVVDAVDCAVQIQQAIAAATADERPEHRMLFRIGLNVGDVMVKDGDIFGAGVNIAARLEALAEPGGICVSRGVRDHLRNKGLLTFEDLGEQRVKNIAQPIRAFRVRFEGVPRTEAAPDRPAATPVGPESSVSDPAAFQLAFWDAIKDSADPAEFEAYLEQYADGPRQARRGAPAGASGGNDAAGTLGITSRACRAGAGVLGECTGER
jgi:adenylate cyclase